ncbi:MULTISPECIES: helix-turn-helix transcriptional regulator [Listeria]|uniref:helix-turn-helix transcriptional regulator n=2 Tax=Listeriaceae TaxID=186820 RepID=UPI0013C2F02E
MSKKKATRKEVNFVKSNINLLGYTLLEMIAREASSGYDLANRLRIMQNTNHSQIYPMLARLEDEGYLIVHTQLQEGKPNKKIYAITENGIFLLKEWSETALKIPVTRDEFIIKLQLDWLNPERTAILLEERMTYLEGQLRLTEDSLVHFEQLLGLATKNDFVNNMSYQIYLRKRDLIRAEIDWCRDILKHKK